MASSVTYPPSSDSGAPASSSSESTIVTKREVVSKPGSAIHVVRLTTSDAHRAAVAQAFEYGLSTKPKK